PSADTLKRINSVQFEACTSDMGEHITPSGLLMAYDKAASETQANLSKTMPGGSPTLTVRTALVYFQTKGVFSGAEAMGRARMYDGSSMVGDVLLRSESDAFTAGGEKSMATAMIKALGKYLEDKRGKPAK